MNITKTFTSIITVTAMFAGATHVLASDYPSGPIKIVVPVPAGGSSDLFARIVADKMQKEFNVPVVVENRAGAGGAIGSSVVAKADSDGYTLLLASGGTHSINPAVYRNLPYDALKDFDPVIRLAVVPNVLVVPKNLPVKSVKELEAYIKQHPNESSFGSSGLGTSIQLTAEMFKQAADLNMVHVPYKGSSPAIADLIGGRLTLMFDNMPSAIAQINGGKLKALAVTSKQRNAAAPAIPTMEEEGYAGFDVTTWFGLLTPAGTPKEVTEKLNKKISSILKEPEVKERFNSVGAEAAGNSVIDFSSYMKEQLGLWGKVASEANIQIN